MASLSAAVALRPFHAFSIPAKYANNEKVSMLTATFDQDLWLI